MNSIMGPIFNEKVAKKWNLWVREQCTRLGQIVWLGKKKNQKTQPKIQRKTLNPNGHLRCPQLSDFRWYKDVFISKVLSRNDCQQSYWKEKFIAGLPYIYTQKVRLDIANNDGTIDYPSLTYGDIISSINKTGLWLCNDLRLKNQIEKEKRYAKKELWTFCEQYGFDPLIAPSRKRRKEKKDDRYNNNNRRYNKSRSKEKKEESKRKKCDRYTENDIICFKCGKKGHTSRYHNFQRKINKLHISGKLKDKLMSILE